ncbi:hypothetical protein EYF80_045309 [Liparis tanakae]|uniref:Uncharacterized protein n=1 Tax=Liparis tanakae TaxID=230148 RepID=A0A4Z2FTA1_9TELE|nr:hypothetical protein EYF80_045309 [Liparis tanakae]
MPDRGYIRWSSSDPDIQSAGLIRFSLVSKKDPSSWRVINVSSEVGVRLTDRVREIVDLIFIIFFILVLTMPSVSVTRLLLLSALLHLTAALPVGDEDEAESFLTLMRSLNAPWSLSRVDSADALLQARLRQLLLSAGPDRRRQLGDIEFSNRYSEFLRSKAKHSSACAFLRRLQSVKRSGEAGELEKVNQLLKQYMCPSVYDNWLNK